MREKKKGRIQFIAFIVTPLTIFTYGVGGKKGGGGKRGDKASREEKGEEEEA